MGVLSVAKPENDVTVIDAVESAPVPDETEAMEANAPEPAPDSVYYSPSTGGFYHDVVHGTAMPDDAIEIGHDAHRDLIAAQGMGKMIVPGKDGAPVAVERPPLSPEQRAAQTGRFRDAALRDTAWRVAEDEPDREVWIAYRAAVRAVDLIDPVWPDTPAA